MKLSWRFLLAWLFALSGLLGVALLAGRPRPVSGPTVTTAELTSIVCRVDATQTRGAISPLIYGMAQPPQTMARDLRLPLTRWGGNPTSRYNWERGNCWNAAGDWGFRNGDYDHSDAASRKPSGVADTMIRDARAMGTDVLLTIPTLGWVARDADKSNRSFGVPGAGGPPVSPGSEAILGYDPTGNRIRVSQRSLPRKPKPLADPPDLTDDVVYQDEWVYHLVRKFGNAQHGGVRYYAMDNEPDLWDGTHRDMHPVSPDYDEILQRFLDYATAVKDVDATAQITGPVSWGWTGYWFSPRDRGSDNFQTHADRNAHGGMAFLPWFLQSVATHDGKTGRRTLDVLDVHYYPQAQGVYNGAAHDVTANALRLRSTRSLWDPSYRDESWVNAPVTLLPRLRQWIAKYYPGTKIGLMEWNWGADDTPNGGLAIAEVLGILGREQADMAAYWAAPAFGSPGFQAYKLFRNADGAGKGFGDTAIRAESNAPDSVSCFGSLDSQTEQPVVLLINKSEHTVSTRLEIKAGVALASAQAFQIAEDWKRIAALPEVMFTDGGANLTLPPGSATLLRCTKSGASR